jgi:hypothetical protein
MCELDRAPGQSDLICAPLEAQFWRVGTINIAFRAENAGPDSDQTSGLFGFWVFLLGT